MLWFWQRNVNRFCESRVLLGLERERTKFCLFDNLVLMRVTQLLVSWRWRNGFHPPVLKHGPRSLTYMRVFGCKTLMRNEGEDLLADWGRNLLKGALSTDRSFTKDLSMSISVGTRKMVIYAWTGWSQGKLWWKLVAILTCKSFVWFGYRGERLIEPSSSWFPPKFPSG